jgi:hypothetical protein
MAQPRHIRQDAAPLASTEANYEARRARQSDIEKSVQVEIHKALIANTLDYLKATSQVLSGLTGVLLTSYIALLVGFRRDSPLVDAQDWVAALAPVILWVASIASGFVMAVTSPRYDFVVLDLGAAMDTYASVVRSRSRQIIVPALLTVGGLIAFVLVFNTVFVGKRPSPAPAKTSHANISVPDAVWRMRADG